ncbi:helix-turn-helix transcriptional regulator [candidate division FCPU426 bacterium]|nr:helix-turn-helix transcriptional regulator [candidate division FCPU426 bacterium]
MKKLISFDAELNKKLKNKRFRKMYEQEKALAKIAVAIEQLRKKQGWSQKDLAARLHTTQQTVSKWEMNSYENIEIKTLEKIASVFKRALRIEFVDVSKHRD